MSDHQSTEHALLDWLAATETRLQTPAYVYDESSLSHSLERFRALLPARARIFYSLKANPQPAIVRAFAGLGVGAEIAGVGELQMCRLAGSRGETILVGGVCKSSAFLRAAVGLRAAAIVLDSPAEWSRLKSIAHASPGARILLRINPGAALGGLDMGGGSQFGLSRQQALSIAAEIVADPHLEFLGLHAYLGSQRLKPEPVLDTIDLVADEVDQFKARGYAPRVVDIGLGLGVPYLSKDAELSQPELRARLQERWKRDSWSDIDVWSEAGRTLIARSGFFVARVLETKQLHGQRFVMLDGGLNAHNPGLGVGRLFRSNPRFLFPGHQEPPTVQTQIVGNLCTSADCIGRDVPCPELSEGDLVVIPNSGAYCQTTALWGFNSQTPFREVLRRLDGGAETLQPQYVPLLGQASRA